MAGFMEVNATAFGRIAGELERNRRFAKRVGLKICPVCGDIFPAETMCAQLCDVLKASQDEAKEDV